MYKSVFLIAVSCLLLFGCANAKQTTSNSNLMTVDIQKKLFDDSKNISQILIDYMNNGKSINDTQQRLIDSYKSKTHSNFDSYTDAEKALVQTIYDMDSERSDYNILPKQSDKLSEMDAFNKNVAALKQLFENGKPK